MKTHLNLLPPSFLYQLRMRRRLAVWMGIWVGVLLLGSGAAWKLRQDLHAKQTEHARLQIATRPLEQLEAETRRLRGEAATIRNRHSIVASLDVDQPPVRLVGLISKTAAELGGDLIVSQLQLNRVTPVAAAASNRPSPGRPGRPPAEPKPDPKAGKMDLTIQGVARDEVLVSQFVESLRASHMFLTVQLRSTSPHHSDSATTRMYEVQCVY